MRSSPASKNACWMSADGLELRRRHGDAVASDLRPDHSSRRLELVRVRCALVDELDDLRDGPAVPLRDIVRHRAPRQQRQVLHPVPRHLEQRLEQEVLEEVVAANVDDERNARPDLRHVREVLIGPDADVRAAGDADPPHAAEHVEVRRLVGDQIVGVEVPAGLRDPRRERRERRIAEGGRRVLRRAVRDRALRAMSRFRKRKEREQRGPKERLRQHEAGSRVDGSQRNRAIQGASVMPPARRHSGRHRDSMRFMRPGCDR